MKKEYTDDKEPQGSNNKAVDNKSADNKSVSSKAGSEGDTPEVSDLSIEVQVPKDMNDGMKTPKDINAPVKHKPSSCLFVASLVFSKSDEELITSVTEHFKVYGPITSVKVLRDTYNRPYAFVQYTSDEDCQLAIKKGHNSLLDGRHLRCEAAKVNRTLFINYNRNQGPEAVRKSLTNFGNIESVHPANKFGLIRNHFEESKFWFVKFMYRDDAIRAYANLSNSPELHVEWAKNVEELGTKKSNNSKDEGYKNFKSQAGTKFDNFSVFVGHLKQGITEEDIRERFSRHGVIKDLRLIDRSGNQHDKENKPQNPDSKEAKLDNFAFIEYEEDSSAARAVELENHSIFRDKTIHVQYKEFHNNSNNDYKGSKFYNHKSNYYYNRNQEKPMGPSRDYNSKTNGGMNFMKPTSPRLNLLAPPPINSIKKANGRRNFYNFDYQEYPFYYYVPGTTGGVNNKQSNYGNPYANQGNVPPYMFDIYNPAMHGLTENYYDYAEYPHGYNEYKKEANSRASTSSTRSKSRTTKSGTYGTDPSTLPSTLDSNQISEKSIDTSLGSNSEYYYYQK